MLSTAPKSVAINTVSSHPSHRRNRGFAIATREAGVRGPPTRPPMAKLRRAPQIARQLVAERALGLRGEIERQDPGGRGDEHREQSNRRCLVPKRWQQPATSSPKMTPGRIEAVPWYSACGKKEKWREAEGRVFGEIGQQPREHAQGGEDEICPALRCVGELLCCDAGLGGDVALWFRHGVDPRVRARFARFGFRHPEVLARLRASLEG